MKKYYFAALLFAFAACSDRGPERREMKAEENSYRPQDKSKAFKSEVQNEDEVLSSSAAKDGFSDSLHQFVRTANLKFRTLSVIQSSFAIEDVIDAEGGYIEHSSIESEVKEENYVKCSKDSSWRVTKFVTVNRLTARVPVENLNMALKSLRPYVIYLDHRTVNAENISFDLYANSLMQKRIAAHSAKAAQFSNKDQALTADQLLERQIQSDNALVDNLRTLDKVQYSTIDIYMYQNEEVKMEKVPVFNDLKSYDSSFGIQFKESLWMGWKVIEFLCLLLVRSWSLLLIVLVTLLVLRNRRKRRQG